MTKKETVEVTSEEKIISKIASFISNFKNIILIALAALVVILVAVVVITTSANKKAEQSFIRVAQYEESLDEMVSSEDNAVVSEYLANVEKEVKDKSYPSVKSAYILGEYYAQKNEWAKAYDYFMKSYNLNSNIYLSKLAVFNAAVAAEEKGDASTALTLYTQVSEDLESPLASKALFNVARINLNNGNKDLAKVTLQQLVDKFSTSEYSALAKNIINSL